jgi:hypothetical protein
MRLCKNCRQSGHHENAFVEHVSSKKKKRLKNRVAPLGAISLSTASAIT